MDRAFLEKFMGQTLNVTITDQRQFVGTLVCTDKVSLGIKVYQNLVFE